MAKVQTRRTVSVNAGVYETLKKEASEAGMTVSQLVTEIIRNALPTLPLTSHQIRECKKCEATKREPSAPERRAQRLGDDVAQVRAVLERLEAALGVQQ